jgi:aminoglycoside phosphotransferase family enzyme/predicted kinase
VSQASDVQQRDIVEFLSLPSSYENQHSAVTVIETHISWVFLTDRHAYKLKKPVRFDFVDFSLPAERRQACLDELRLNRRLAPDVYVDAIPITQESNGKLRLGGAGRELDWVVKMRRLPAYKSLDRVLKEPRLTQTDAETISRFLEQFYISLPSEAVSPKTYRQAIERHIRANQDALLKSLPDDQMRVRRIHSAQLRYLNVQKPVLDSRVLSGRVVEGHGDLRPEHIYLENPPVVIDCIEFSKQLRTLDIADELNFLAMECDRLGNGEFGKLILSTHEEMSGDRIPAHLSSFYRCYRACVRAKVALLQAGQQMGDQQRNSNRQARQYIDWADHYAAQLGRPSMLIVFGLSGTGKSTLAKMLAKSLDADVLSTDHIRRSMIGTSLSPAKYGEGLYSADSRNQVYDELFRQAGAILDKSQSLILDGTFSSRELRSRARYLARRHGAEMLSVWCECSKATSLARIQKRIEHGHSESEARADLYESQACNFQVPDEKEITLRIDTTAELTNQLQDVYDMLGKSLDDRCSAS